jgi:hypothetical protein
MSPAIMERVNEPDEISGSIVPAPPVADIRYEEDTQPSRVLVRVEWPGGKIREYETGQPGGFEMNDPETDLSFAPARMAVQVPGSPVVPVMAAAWTLRLSFRADPWEAEIRTERTARAPGPAALAGTGEVKPYAPRSTPAGFPDCAEVTDSRGQTWRYSEPADVWNLVNGAAGMVVLSSARSFQRLQWEFGPLTLPAT